MSVYTSKQTIIEAIPPSETLPIGPGAFFQQTMRLMDAGFYFRILGVLFLIGIVNGVLGAFGPVTSPGNLIWSLACQLIMIPLTFAMYDYLMQRAERKEPLSFIETVYDKFTSLLRVYYTFILLFLFAVPFIIIAIGLLWLMFYFGQMNVMFSIFLVAFAFIFIVTPLGAPLLPLALRTNLGIGLYRENFAIVKRNWGLLYLVAVWAPLLYFVFLFAAFVALAMFIGGTAAILLGFLVSILLNPFMILYCAVLWARLKAEYVPLVVTQ